MRLHGLAVAAALIALSAPAFGAQTAPAAKAVSAKAAKPAKVTVITTSGTVTKFDAASNTLTVTTPKGDVMFTVDASAAVTAAGKKVAASDLPNHVGQKVMVRYTESGSQKMAQSVKVTAGGTKAAAMKKSGAAKKS